MGGGYTGSRQGRNVAARPCHGAANGMLSMAQRRIGAGCAALLTQPLILFGKSLESGLRFAAGFRGLLFISLSAFAGS
jgi:hypothetical protein